MARYVYWWVDGIHTGLRSEPSDGQCLLVILGVTPDGRKERVALADGHRESKESWRELLLDLKARGLQAGPRLAVGDGAMGFWAAFGGGVSGDRGTALLVPQDGQCDERAAGLAAGQGEGGLAGDLDGGTRAEAHKAFAQFAATYQAKYPEAVEKLVKDRDSLLRFTTSLPSTGSTWARPTRSSRLSPPYAIAPRVRATACRAQPSWGWPSS